MNEAEVQRNYKDSIFRMLRAGHLRKNVLQRASYQNFLERIGRR